MRDLSILIPARNEMFLNNTIEDILSNIEANTEIIVVLDGSWSEPSIKDNSRVEIIYHNHSIGQRAATNEAAKLSRAKFVMKADAHCAFDKGFDRKLIEPYQNGELDYTITSVPRMYNLHVFDWQCTKCKTRTYQGPKPASCKKCKNTEFEMFMVWTPRWNRMSEALRFDKDLKFQYWKAYESKPEAKVDLMPTLGCLGACFMLNRERYWELGGLDEKHGSWGQLGTEVAIKSWLSGGKLVCNRKTWFSHLFRTNDKGFSFPYPISGTDVHRARKYSQDLWLNNKWPKAKHSLRWLLEQFWPIPGWTDADLAKLSK